MFDGMFKALVGFPRRYLESELHRDDVMHKLWRL